MDHFEQSEGTENATKLDVEYKFNDDTWFDSVKAGVRWSERDQTTRFSSYNWGALSEIWGNNGPVWFDDPINGNPATAGGETSARVLELFSFNNFLRGKVTSPAGDGRLFFSQNTVDNYGSVANFALAVGDEWRARPGRWLPAELGAFGAALRRDRRNAVPSAGNQPRQRGDQGRLSDHAVQGRDRRLPGQR